MIEPLGEVTLPLSLGSYPKRSTKMVKFLVVKAPSAYNIILGRPSLNLFRAISSTFHMKLKFPTSDGVGEAVGDERMARECYANTLKRSRERLGGVPYQKEKRKMTDMGLEIKDAPEEPFGKIGGERRVEAVEELKVINLSEDDEKTTNIGTTMRPSTEEHLIQFLKKNKEVFAWTMTDLHGISPDVITHKLSVNPSAKSVKQKKRMFGPERSQAIKEEVDKMLQAGYIRPVQYPEWLANVVLVPKPNGKWRLCIDFTDLNKACPKDPFPLPRIDILVDSTSGCEMLSFLDAYQGYNQIPLAPKDQEKASFVKDQGVFCYNVMPFGLKKQERRTNDLSITCFKIRLAETWSDFWYEVKPRQVHLWGEGGRFLGYMISERGIEANPEKINAIMDMSPPKSIREVQKLAGRLAALNRFISRSADKGLPFFKILRGGAKFEWSKKWPGSI
ncbi:Transposon Ty3-G Gag-Pol polyprotein [Sesamum angolense]|uniref:Transposon Ty3-G Gag-Pol polyprotein n=1 Tax=Sesamum angolense TaxID=2727404 RepID=A0AAE1T9I7_9LAMI|nr:Transposon Ty3-G Gag-Pol polyprotein [Sesamum angolense]